MFSIQEIKNLETFLFEDRIGCVFKKVYSDGSERIFIEYSGYTVLEKSPGIVVQDAEQSDNYTENFRIINFRKN